MKQDALFSEEEMIPWKREWQNMPEYSVEDLAPRYQLIINFASEADVYEFAELIGQKIAANASRQLRSTWYPEQGIARLVNKRYIDESQIPDFHSN